MTTRSATRTSPKGWRDTRTGAPSIRGSASSYTAGAVVLGPQFGHASDFSEGLAAAKEPEGRWGFVDRSGRWVIRPSSDLAEPMRYGLARVEVWKDGRNESGFRPVRVGYVDLAAEDGSLNGKTKDHPRR